MAERRTKGGSSLLNEKMGKKGEGGPKPSLVSRIAGDPWCIRGLLYEPDLSGGEEENHIDQGKRARGQVFCLCEPLGSWYS